MFDVKFIVKINWSYSWFLKRRVQLILFYKEYLSKISDNTVCNAK